LTVAAGPPTTTSIVFMSIKEYMFRRSLNTKVDRAQIAKLPVYWASRPSRSAFLPSQIRLYLRLLDRTCSSSKSSNALVDLGSSCLMYVPRPAAIQYLRECPSMAKDPHGCSAGSGHRLDDSKPRKGGQEKRRYVHRGRPGRC
jgi:hypothetical protein